MNDTGWSRFIFEIKINLILCIEQKLNIEMPRTFSDWRQFKHRNVECKRDRVITPTTTSFHIVENSGDILKKQQIKINKRHFYWLVDKNFQFHSLFWIWGFPRQKVKYLKAVLIYTRSMLLELLETALLLLYMMKPQYNF